MKFISLVVRYYVDLWERGIDWMDMPPRRQIVFALLFLGTALWLALMIWAPRT